jgi:hypothetical protein
MKHQTMERKCLSTNEFPNEIIGGAPGNSMISQPETKAQLTNGLLNIKLQLDYLVPIIFNETCIGKAKHPGFNYLNGQEWLQLAEMHYATIYARKTESISI